MVGMFLKFSQPEPKLLTADVKETTVKSIGNIMANTSDDETKHKVCAALIILMTCPISIVLL